jgi:hypothetical protein
VPYIPGSPIDAYCGNCKSDTNHVVLEVDGIQVREVRCEKCSTRGEFRAPRAKARAGLKEALRRKSMPPPPRRKNTRRKAETPEQIFEKLVDGRDVDAALPYNIRTVLKVGDMVDHPKFGLGVVAALPEDQKARIFFEDGERVMVCNKG